MSWNSGATSVKTLTSGNLAILRSRNALAANKPAPRPAPLAPAQQASHAAQAAQVAPSAVLVTMGQELDREMPILSRTIPPAYFINYTLTSTQRSEVMGSKGALLSSQ